MNAPHQNPNVTTYVLGFAFDLSTPDASVCLIEKQKPDWQVGLLNGVGGKMEENDHIADLPPTTEQNAMSREFREETGVEIRPHLWHRFLTMRFANGAVVHCFTTQINPSSPRPRTMEAEFVDMYAVDRNGSLAQNIQKIVPNLNWLVPMAYHELYRIPSERMIVT